MLLQNGGKNESGLLCVGNERFRFGGKEMKTFMHEKRSLSDT